MNAGGSKIRMWRRKRGISLSTLYDLTGISIASISRIEHGKKVPHDEEITLIADALRLDLDIIKNDFDQQRLAQARLIGLTDSERSIRLSDAMEYCKNIRNIIFKRHSKSEDEENLWEELFTSILSSEIEGESTSIFIYRVEEAIKKTSEVIEYGVPPLASEWLEKDIIPALQKKALICLKNQPPETPFILDLWSIAVSLQAASYSLWKLKPEAIEELFKASRTLDWIASVSDNKLAMVLNQNSLASTYYLLNDNKKAINFAKTGYDQYLSIGLKDIYLRWQLLSLWAVNSAKIGDKNGAYEALDCFRPIIDQNYVEPFILHRRLETIARVEGDLVTKNFWKEQEKARYVVFGDEGIPVNPYTALLINRNELEAMIKLEDFDQNRADQLLDQSKLIGGKIFTRLLNEIYESVKKIYDEHHQLSRKRKRAANR